MLVKITDRGVGRTYISVLAETGGPVRRLLHLVARPPLRRVQLANDGIMHCAVRLLPA